MKELNDLFAKAVFQYPNKNIPIPVPLTRNLKAYTDAFETNSILYTLIDYKAKKSAKIKPLIVKETDKQNAKEFLKWNGKYTDKYELKNLKQLRLKSFEEIPMEDIDLRSELFGLKSLLTRPNDYQTFAQFLYAQSAFEDASGWRAFYKYKGGLKNGKTLKLNVLPTNLVEILGGTYDEPISGYKFTNNYKERFEPEEVLRISGFSFNYDLNGGHLYGTSKVKAAWTVFQNHAQALERQYNSFNNGDLRALLMPKEGVGVPQDAADGTPWYQLFRDSIFRGFKQLGPQRTAIIGASMDVVQFNSELRDNIITTALKDAKGDTASVWGFKSEVVFNTGDGAKYENQEKYIADSLRGGVFPSLIELEEGLREDIVKKEYQGYSLIFDYDVYEELTKDQTKEIVALKDATMLSINEKRAYLDYEPYDDPAADIPEALRNELVPPSEPLPNDGGL
ncbi:MAG: phage portal protein [Cytophagales bacterium]|nr:phage portal protein [Cytophagales bacterium]